MIEILDPGLSSASQGDPKIFLIDNWYPIHLNIVFWYQC